MSQQSSSLLRIRTKLDAAVDQLNSRSTCKFVFDDETPGIWIVRTLPSTRLPGSGPFTATVVAFNEQGTRITSSPTATFTKELADHHEFTFDVQGASFMENGCLLTDEEMVKRALGMFVRHSLSTRSLSDPC